MPGSGIDARVPGETRLPDEAVASLASLIDTVPDHPEPGIVFRDIGPLLAAPGALALAASRMASPFRDLGIDVVVGVESRGFMFAPQVAEHLGAGVVPARKAGKLPGEVIAESYELEYGTAVLEIQRERLEADHRVLVVDDVLATGGTANAAISLAQARGATVVGCSFLIDIGLGGAEELHPIRVEAVVDFGEQP